VSTNVPHAGRMCAAMCLVLVCDADPYRAQMADARIIALPRPASILRRTRYHARGADLLASH
jgi:hypothetical protein